MKDKSMSADWSLTLFDLIVICALYLLGFRIGAANIARTGRSWIALNTPLIAVMAVGGAIWYFLRRPIKSYLEK